MRDYAMEADLKIKTTSTAKLKKEMVGYNAEYKAKARRELIKRGEYTQKRRQTTRRNSLFGLGRLRF